MVTILLISKGISLSLFIKLGHKKFLAVYKSQGRAEGVSSLSLFGSGNVIRVATQVRKVTILMGQCIYRCVVTTATLKIKSFKVEL